MYLYLDESGDLGFDFKKAKTSRYFVVTILVCHNQQAQKAIMKAQQKTLKNKIKPIKKGEKKTKELKGTNTLYSIKRYFYDNIRSNDWVIFSLILNKSRVYEKFHSTKGQNKIYNFLSRLIIEKLPLNDAGSNVRLIVDKSKNRAEIKDFNQYISNHVEGMLPLNTGFAIDHLGSHEDPCLQAVDLFCWGIWRKYASNDTQWHHVFESKIEYEDVYLP